MTKRGQYPTLYHSFVLIEPGILLQLPTLEHVLHLWTYTYFKTALDIEMQAFLISVSRNPRVNLTYTLIVNSTRFLKGFNGI